MDRNLSNAETYNTQGNVYFASGNYKNALYKYESAIQECPNTAKYYGNRSACHLMLKNYVKAQTDAQKAIEIDPKYLKGYIRIVKCCLHDGNLKYASTTIQSAQNRFPEETKIKELHETVTKLQEYFQKHENHLNKGEYLKALEYIKHCLNVEANCVMFMLAKANCLIYLKEFNEAEKIADDVLNMSKNNEDAIFIQTCAKCYQQDVPQVIKLLIKLKKKLPDHFKTNQLYTNTMKINENIQLIEEYIQNYSYKEAYDLTNKTLKIDPYYVVINKRLRRRKIDIAQGVEMLYWKGAWDCDEFIKLYGDELNLLHVKVKLLMDLEEYEDAIEVYEKILTLENNQTNEDNLNEARTKLDAQNNDDKIFLRLSGDLTRAKIANAASKLKYRYHVDKNPKITPERKRKLEEKFVRVTCAEKHLLQQF